MIFWPWLIVAFLGGFGMGVLILCVVMIGAEK